MVSNATFRTMSSSTIESSARVSVRRQPVCGMRSSSTTSRTCSPGLDTRPVVSTAMARALISPITYPFRFALRRYIPAFKISLPDRPLNVLAVPPTGPDHLRCGRECTRRNVKRQKDAHSGLRHRSVGPDMDNAPKARIFDALYHQGLAQWPINFAIRIEVILRFAEVARRPRQTVTMRSEATAYPVGRASPRPAGTGRYDPRSSI